MPQTPLSMDSSRSKLVKSVESSDTRNVATAVTQWPNQSAQDAVTAHRIFPRTELMLLSNPYRSPDVILRLLYGALLFDVPSMFHLTAVLNQYSHAAPEKSDALIARKQRIYAYFQALLQKKRANFQRAYLHWLLGNDGEARNLLDRMRKSPGKYVNNAEFHLLIGKLAEDTQARSDAFEKARKLGCYEASYLFITSGRDISTNDQLIHLLDAGDALSLQEAALILASTGKMDDAFDTFDEAIKLGSAHAANSGALTALENGDINRAIKFWRSGSELDSTCAVIGGESLYCKSLDEQASELYKESGPLYGYARYAELWGIDSFREEAQRAFEQVAEYLVQSIPLEHWGNYSCPSQSSEIN
eukprot:GILK01009344.1.p1 GENE.GILK01009344.1~~GILK01009344.1.p1  ORF type:complete len:360 (+),score=33.66 GILK01009344.1:149-1228(+)